MIVGYLELVFWFEVKEYRVKEIRVIFSMGFVKWEYRWVRDCVNILMLLVRYWLVLDNLLFRLLIR